METIPVIVPLYNEATHKITWVTVMMDRRLVESGLMSVTQPPKLALKTDEPLKKLFWEIVAELAPYLRIPEPDLKRMGIDHLVQGGSK